LFSFSPNVDSISFGWSGWVYSSLIVVGIFTIQTKTKCNLSETENKVEISISIGIVEVKTFTRLFEWRVQGRSDFMTTIRIGIFLLQLLWKKHASSEGWRSSCWRPWSLDWCLTFERVDTCMTGIKK
jgi:hypothetical protein